MLIQTLAFTVAVYWSRPFRSIATPSCPVTFLMMVSPSPRASRFLSFDVSDGSDTSSRAAISSCDVAKGEVAKRLATFGTVKTHLSPIRPQRIRVSVPLPDRAPGPFRNTKRFSAGSRCRIEPPSSCLIARRVCGSGQRKARKSLNSAGSGGGSWGREYGR